MDEPTLVTLVDEDGGAIGEAEKLAAHQPPGVLHLAFSVFVFRSDGETLLQRRARTKYHFPGLWTNACCSHPRPGEDVLTAARRRVSEELGITIEPRRVGSFTYKAVCPTSGLVEHEFDHVLVATTSSEVRPDPDEVEAVRWVAPDVLLGRESSYALTPWFLPALRVAQAAGATR